MYIITNFQLPLLMSLQTMLNSFVFITFASSSLYAEDQQTIYVKVFSEIQSEPGLIQFSEIASITDHKGQEIQSFSELDVCRLQKDQPQEITREFLALRLSLASEKPLNIRWSGSPTVIVTERIHAATLTQRIERAIEAELVQKLNRSPSDIRIRFLRPLSEVFHDSELLERSLVPEVTWENPTFLGRTTVGVRLLRNRNIETSRLVPLEIAVRQYQLRISSEIEKHSQITLGNVEVIDDFVIKKEEQILPTEVYGRIARRRLRTGERLKLSDLEQVNKVVPREIVVRPRDAIRLTARHNNLEFVVPQAEAMQSGQIGQIIRVKNLQSNRVVNARLISSEEAVVDLR